jgi:hypothetical protein
MASNGTYFIVGLALSQLVMFSAAFITALFLSFAVLNLKPDDAS